MKKINEYISKTITNSDIQIFEMASVGIVNGYKNEVWTKEGGNIPHFHVHKDDKNGKELNAPIR